MEIFHDCTIFSLVHKYKSFKEWLLFMLNDKPTACSYWSMGCTWKVATHERSVRESHEAIAECGSNRLKDTCSLCSIKLPSLTFDTHVIVTWHLSKKVSFEHYHVYHIAVSSLEVIWVTESFSFDRWSSVVFDWIARQSQVNCSKQGRFVRKPVNANLG